VSAVNWSYGGVTYVVDSARVVETGRHKHIGAYLLGLLLTVVAPLTAAVWALVKYWPISGAVWLAGTLAFWAVAMSTAADEDDLVLS
jgi:hypothetical protein